MTCYGGFLSKFNRADRMCITNRHLAHKPRWTRFKMTGSDKIWWGSFLAVFENRNPYWMIIMKCGPGGHSLSWSPLELRNYVIFRYSWGHWIYHDVQWHIIRIHTAYGTSCIPYSNWIHLCPPLLPRFAGKTSSWCSGLGSRHLVTKPGDLVRPWQRTPRNRLVAGSWRAGRCIVNCCWNSPDIAM